MAVAWPLAARAQERVRRIGVLLPAAADDAEFQAYVGAFLQALALLGWTIGRNVRIDTRWAAANAADIRRHAAELAALAPDVILAHGALDRGAVAAGDPHRADRVPGRRRSGRRRLRRQPGAAGRQRHRFHDYSNTALSGKWLELLKQIAPGVTRVAVLRDPTQGPGTSQFAVIQAAAPSLRVEVIPLNMRDAGEIERAVAASRALRMAA